MMRISFVKLERLEAGNEDFHQIFEITLSEKTAIQLEMLDLSESFGHREKHLDLIVVPLSTWNWHLVDVAAELSDNQRSVISADEAISDQVSVDWMFVEARTLDTVN
jgi:hypothetical protein